MSVAVCKMQTKHEIDHKELIKEWFLLELIKE